MDKFIISAGPMADMAFTHDGPMDEETVWDPLDWQHNAFIHKVNGVWVLNRKKLWCWMRPLANAGMSWHRLALTCVGGSAPRSSLFMPWGFVPSRDAWDMNIKNVAYFNILRELVIELNKMHVRAEICIGNECDERKEDRKRQSPHFHNVNGFEGLYADKALPFWATLTEWTLAALEGTDYAIELINEGHRPRSGSVDAVKAMIPALVRHDVKPWLISLGADTRDAITEGFKPVSDWPQRWPNDPAPPVFENYDLFLHALVPAYEPKYPNFKTTHGTFYVCHSFATDAPKDYPDIHPYGRRTGFATEAMVGRNLGSNRLGFSTDGGKRPSPKRMKAGMLWVMNFNRHYRDTPMLEGQPKLWFDFLPEGQKIPEIAKIVDAMSEAHYEFFGAWPVNRGTVPRYEDVYPEPTPPVPPTPPPPKPPVPPTPPTPPEPPAPPVPEPEPVPVKPEPWWAWNRIRNVRRWTWQAWLGLTIILIVCSILLSIII